MNFLDRIKNIDGVEDVKYYYSMLSLTVYYHLGLDLDLLKIRIMEQIDKANLHESVEKIVFLSIEETIFRASPLSKGKQTK